MLLLRVHEVLLQFLRSTASNALDEHLVRKFELTIASDRPNQIELASYRNNRNVDIVFLYNLLHKFLQPIASLGLELDRDL